MLDAAGVSPSFFRAMASQPMLGRYLAEGEEGPKAPLVVVLSYSLWRGRFGSDHEIIGKSIQLDRQSYTIVGVMPQGFDFPHGTEVWRPMTMDESSQRPRMASRPMFLVNLIARIRPGVTETALDTELSRLAHDIRAEYAEEFRSRFLHGFVIQAGSLQRRIAGDLRPALLVLTGAVLLVLLIVRESCEIFCWPEQGRRHELAVGWLWVPAAATSSGNVIQRALAVPGARASRCLIRSGRTLTGRSRWCSSAPRISLDLRTLTSPAITLDRNLSASPRHCPLWCPHPRRARPAAHTQSAADPAFAAFW